MKSTLSFLIILSLVCAIALSDASAAGLGFYGTVGDGTADWSPDSERGFNKKTSHIGFGLVMDTAPAYDKLFNYHLTIGYERFSDENINAWGNARFDSFVISNNFGFGALITPTTRLWFGPEVRIAWADGTPSSYSDYKIRLMGIGFGPVVGINFNMGNDHTFVIKTGYQFLHYAGEGEGYFSHSTNTASAYSNSYDYDVTEKFFYVTLEFLIRTSGDRY